MQNLFALDIETRLVATARDSSNSEGAAETDKAVTASKTVRARIIMILQTRLGGKGKDVGNRRPFVADYIGPQQTFPSLGKIARGASYLTCIMARMGWPCKSPPRIIPIWILHEELVWTMKAIVVRLGLVTASAQDMTDVLYKVTAFPDPNRILREVQRVAEYRVVWISLESSCK
jgi:hypothetical protein